jgi:hypothetical protein
LNNDIFDNFDKAENEMNEKVDSKKENEKDNENNFKSIYITQRPDDSDRPFRRDEYDIPFRRERPSRPRRPFEPGRPYFPEYTELQETPFRGRPPRTAPPDITPLLPRGVVIPLPGTSDFNTLYRDVNRNNTIASQFRNCLNHFTFIWLWNGRSFWFYPIFVGRRTAEGFVWRGNGWVYDSINLNRIFFFRCF